MRARPWLVLLVWLTILVPQPARAQSIQYMYDELGRLIAVVDPGGDTAVYHYDAVGNVLSIARHASSQVSVVSFTPGSGPVGTQVRIFGTGFSSTIAQDTVTFNGTTATISSATATQLVVTVPSGATTGTIGVTAPGGSATSAATFTVTSVAAPTISSFTPSIGVAGTSVSVTGTNFDTTASNDRVKVNATLAAVSSVTSTSLGTTIPSLAASGPITIATPLGTAVSATDLFVAPSPYGTSDVSYTSRLAMGASQTVTISTANRIGLVTFAGTAGQRFSLVASSGTFGGAGGCNLHVSVLKPNTSVLSPAACMGTTGFIDGTTLPVTGTYTMLLEPGSTTGSVTLALYDASDATGTITAGGSAVTASTTIPGQNVALTFSGTSGQRVSILGASASFTNLTFSCEAVVRIRKADGSALSGDACVEFGGFLDTVTLPATGSYAVVLDPASTATGSVSLTLYDVPADASASITAGGSAVTLTMSTPGQNGALTFSGTAGHQITLLGTSSTFTNLTFDCELTLRITKPDGSTLVGNTCMEFGGYIDVTTLPTTGTYTITLDPGLQDTGSLTLALYDVPGDVTASITPGGSAVTVTIATPGQGASVTFSGTSGQRISLRGTSASFPNLTFNCELTVRIRKPDGSTLVGDTCFEGGGFIDVTTLSATGTYTITLDPGSYATGSITLTLYDVPADVSGSITAGGSSVTMTITTPGQNGTLTFSGTSGQRISLLGTSSGFTNLTFNCDVPLTIKKPDGSTLVANGCMEGGGFVDVTTLAASGTYTIALDPAYWETGSVTFTLYDVPADVSTSVTIGGSSATLTTTVAGQNALATFSGTASQQVTVHLTSNSIGGSTTVRLLKPDGSTLTSSSSSSSSFNLSTQTLPTTGTYTVAVDPSTTNTGSLTVNVTNP
jgi:YD repeat-containing protein